MLDVLFHGPPISIHAPREGSDMHSVVATNLENLFQSTLPARGATNGHHSTPDTNAISIHAPREGSDATANSKRWRSVDISIHAPREGSDGTTTGA